MADLLPQDWLTPAIAYTVSAIGSFLGLSFASRARRASGLFRLQWLALASLALGGMGVWSMHFIAMLGYSVPGTVIRYDALLTVISGLVPILVMGAALYLVIRFRGAVRLLAGGVLLGLGIVSMHYTGMASMNLHGDLHHDPVPVAVSAVIAVFAATAVLWGARRLSHYGAIALASLLLALTITAVHYTGMSGVYVTEPHVETVGPPDGLKALDLLLPMIIGLFVLLLICSLLLLLSDSEDESRDPARRGSREPEPTTAAASPGEYAPRHSAVNTTTPPATDDVWSRTR
ncbi:MHYT domain-containing protein [Nocardiopsis sp. LDBS1602]|uniref:MHYT domain-containing protein n=1 Tax=Nocardiopsis sp. LDBS1602 TaxID=3109597 RepID=UPI002DBEA99D|nr:MHYT domain-containing protein [Nocardiopsis sp. LDBS1602]MEC3892813.1 MHYT domain-containing protein [Nocardiopsis sp. LDBS1602]